MSRPQTKLSNVAKRRMEAAKKQEERAKLQLNRYEVAISRTEPLIKMQIENVSVLKKKFISHLKSLQSITVSIKNKTEALEDLHNTEDRLVVQMLREKNILDDYRGHYRTAKIKSAQKGISPDDLRYEKKSMRVYKSDIVKSKKRFKNAERKLKIQSIKCKSAKNTLLDLQKEQKSLDMEVVKLDKSLKIMSSEKKELYNYLKSINDLKRDFKMKARESRFTLKGGIIGKQKYSPKQVDKKIAVTEKKHKNSLNKFVEIINKMIQIFSKKTHEKIVKPTITNKKKKDALLKDLKSVLKTRPISKKQKPNIPSKSRRRSPGV